MLQRAQFQQMIDTVFVALDVAVKHGGVRLQPDFVRGARDSKPIVAVDLVVADDVPHTIRENLRSAAWQGIQSRPLQPSSTSRGVLFPMRAKKAISTMVNALRCTCGKCSLRPLIRSR